MARGQSCSDGPVSPLYLELLHPSEPRRGIECELRFLARANIQTEGRPCRRQSGMHQRIARRSGSRLLQGYPRALSVPVPQLLHAARIGLHGALFKRRSTVCGKTHTKLRLNALGASLDHSREIVIRTLLADGRHLPPRPRVEQNHVEMNDVSLWQVGPSHDIIGPQIHADPLEHLRRIRRLRRQRQLLPRARDVLQRQGAQLLA
jgi:hypothetical protein